MDGEAATRASHGVEPGSIVAVTVPPLEAATPRAEALPLDIVYEDEDLVVVDKPAGMVVHPAAGHATGTLVNALLHHVRGLSGVGGERRPGIVHRLDKGTSGLMVVAKHDQAHWALARRFAGRTVEKEYVALVWGAPRAGRTIDSPIGRDPLHRKRMTVAAPRSRAAATTILTSEPLDGLALVRIAIATGRTHQIRVHLSSIGHPIVGDALYGGVRRHLSRGHAALASLERPFLHARRLAFDHPRDDHRMVFEAPLPDDLQSVLDALRAVASGGQAR